MIREEKMMAAYDLLEIYCELIVARLPIIESQKYVYYVLYSAHNFLFYQVGASFYASTTFKSLLRLNSTSALMH